MKKTTKIENKENRKDFRGFENIKHFQTFCRLGTSLRRTKKAQITKLKVLIIGAVVAILLLFFVSNIGEEISSATRIAQCRQSVESNALLRLGAADFSSEIVCPTKELKIKSKDELQIKYALANEMTECWEIFQKGEKELFSDDGVFCSICSRVVFTKLDDPIKAFPEFLLKTKIPGKEQTYADYLHNYEKAESTEILEEIEKAGNALHIKEIEINPAKEYAVIFGYIKGKDALENFYKKGRHVVGGAAVIAAGVGIMKVGGLISAMPFPGARFIGVPVAAVGSLISAGGLLWSITGAWFDRESPQWASFVELREYTGT
ncbi:MAG: hypothetical protein V3V78_00585, partial [Candidatus Woesearchaeota archaeon]